MTLDWQIVKIGKHYLHTSEHFEIHLERTKGKELGYPQCRVMWHMRFRRGGWHAQASHQTINEAKCNAARIAGYQLGTNDVLGNPLN